MGQPVGPGGRYTPLELLGEGGAGTVWLVEDRNRNGRRLALKRLQEQDPAKTPAGGVDRAESSLRSEYATLSTLHHPGLVEVHDFGVSPEDGSPFFTLEYVEGLDLVKEVRRAGPASLPELAAEALRVLGFFHDFGILHGDLKPGNLLVRKRPRLGCRLVLLDFGLARPASAPGKDRTAGTLQYLAPECFEGCAPTPRSDLYALGAVLYEAIHGRPPVEWKENDLGRFVQAVQEGRRSHPALPAGYRAGWAGWLEELLHPKPEARPESAAEALGRLNAACGLDLPMETDADRVARLNSGPPPGREALVEELETWLREPGGARLRFLTGGPGMGKTRILRWIESRGILHGLDVIYRNASAWDSGSLRHLEASGGGTEKLCLLDEAEQAGFHLARDLDRFARAGLPGHVRILAAVEPGSVVQPVLARLLTGDRPGSSADRTGLPRLDRESLERLIARGTGRSVSKQRVDWLLHASEGIPLQAEALLLDEAWERGGDRNLPLPAAAGSAWDPTLRRLSEPARCWIEALAVFGNDTPSEHLRVLARLTPEEAETAAAEVIAAGLAQETGSNWSLESRELAGPILSRLSAQERDERYRAALEVWRRAPEKERDPWRQARLAEGAGDLPQAYQAMLDAVRVAREKGDPAEGARRCASALRLLHRIEPRSPERRLLRGRQAELLTRAGLHAAAVRAWGAAVRLASTREEKLYARTAQAGALVRAGRFQAALRAARQVEAEATRAGLDALAAQAVKEAGLALGRLGREKEAIPFLERSLENLGDNAAPEGKAEMLQVLGACRMRLGVEGAGPAFQESIHLYEAERERSGERPGSGELKARIGLALIENRDGRRQKAESLLEQVEREATLAGDLSVQEVALSRLAVLAIDQGRLDVGMEISGKAADLAAHLEDRNLLLVNRCRQADALTRCGRPGKAMTLLHETLGEPLLLVEPENIDYARMTLAGAMIQAAGEKDAEIRRLLHQVLNRCRRRKKPRALLMALVLEIARCERA